MNLLATISVHMLYGEFLFQMKGPFSSLSVAGRNGLSRPLKVFSVFFFELGVLRRMGLAFYFSGFYLLYSLFASST